jgi:type VI secretion system ImpC/EvpB family protein
LYEFQPTSQSIQALSNLSKSTAAAAFILLAGAAPTLLGCADIATATQPEDWRERLSAAAADAWQVLRIQPEASSLGLVLPRFLLRQPYGSQSDPIDAFPFEELTSESGHEDYLWGNSAILCAQLFIESFLSEGWDLNLAGYGEVNELPVHQYTAHGQRQIKPCAEAWLSDRAGEAILEQGLIPILSIKNRDAVKIPRLQSITRGHFSTHGIA